MQDFHGRPIVSEDDIVPSVHGSMKTITGITISNKQLFVAFKEYDHVEVFDSTSLEFRRGIEVPNMTGAIDLASNERVVFVSDNDAKVHCLGEYRVIWSETVGRGSASISLNKSGNLLVSSSGTNAIYEYTTPTWPKGQLLRMIKLQDSIVEPKRVIQMDHDLFLVCQTGGGVNDLHRVCLVSNGGKLLHSFGATMGNGRNRLHNPYRLIVERETGYILIADSGNCRVVVLDKQLEYVKQYIPVWDGPNFVFSLFLDDFSDKLYLSNHSGIAALLFILKLGR